jgi:hypothetical protein
MSRIRIRLPRGSALDPHDLAAAVRMVVTGGLSDPQRWRPNPVPAIGPPEEGAPLVSDLHEDIVDLLNLPEERRAAALADIRSMSSSDDLGILVDLQKALRPHRTGAPPRRVNPAMAELEKALRPTRPH